MNDIHPGIPGKRLLLVEDDRDNLHTLSILLETRYQVFPYLSAAEAVAAIDVAEPDLLVLDIGMRPIDGLECLRAIRAMPRHRETPALALTGYAHPADRERFLDAGFQAVVVKPIVDHAHLTTLIDELLLRRPRLDTSRTAEDRAASPSSSSSDVNIRSSRSDAGARP